MIRIRLFFYELFHYKIPDLWWKIKHAFKDNFWLSFGVFISVISVMLAIYQGVQYNRYETARAQQKIIQKKQQKNASVMNIPDAGAEAYLEQQLGVKNKEQVIKMFNDSVEYQGKYDEVISKTKDFKSNDQFQDYLNPIVKELLNGPLVSQAQTGIDFYDKPVDISSDEALNGVLLVLINSKDQSQVEAVKELKSKKHNYTIRIYDKRSDGGEGNFNTLRINYLFGGNGERKGFNSSNDWSGVAYGFNDRKFTYHTKSLKDIPDSLPDKSISKEDEETLR